MFVSVVAFIFVLGVMIFVHELGHFLTAKWIGVKVHVFSLGFPPKLIGKTWGDTEYRIGLLPLGGYVKMAGENPGEVTGNKDEFFSRTKLERMAILVMGPAMNIVLTIFLFTVLFMVGIERPVGLEDAPVVRFVSADSPAAAAGVETGDRIVALDGTPVESWLEVLDTFHLSPNQTLTMTLDRNGETVETKLAIEARGEEEIGYTGLFPAVQPRVEGLTEGYPAEQAGLRQGDLLIKVDDEPIFSNQELIEAIEGKQGQSVKVTILRDDAQQEVNVTPIAEGERFLIGVELPSPVAMHQITNPVGAFGAAIGETTRLTELTFVVLGRLFQRRLSMRQMMGPIGIARVSGEAARTGARNLFTLMAVISLQLGIFNLLPVPVLDGGHIAIILVEGLARRDFSMQVKERVLQVGFVLLVLLMVTVIYVDLSKIESIGRFLP
ncbi:MAG TPA: RIP metalloprotease RseP [Vicinamibacteria bacterium]